MPRVVPSQVVALIDQLFPWVEAQDHDRRNLGIDSLPHLAAVLELIQQVPQEFIILDPNQYVAFAKSVAATRAIITAWQGGFDRYPLEHLRAFEDGSPLSLLRRTLTLCPDEFPATGTAELTFIQDQELRESLRIDLSATNRALSNGEWKAATVLAGSVVEALLLWALQQRPTPDVSSAVTRLVQNNTLRTNPGTDLEKWDLHGYIEVAAELNVINPDTATQARLAKDFRNLIHPGRAARLGQACDRATALSAVAAVEHVVRDLT